jgi:hypothetical protein
MVQLVPSWGAATSDGTTGPLVRSSQLRWDWSLAEEQPALSDGSTGPLVRSNQLRWFNWSPGEEQPAPMVQLVPSWGAATSDGSTGPLVRSNQLQWLISGLNSAWGWISACCCRNISPRYSATSRLQWTIFKLTKISVFLPLLTGLHVLDSTQHTLRIYKSAHNIVRCNAKHSSFF